MRPTVPLRKMVGRGPTCFLLLFGTLNDQNYALACVLEGKETSGSLVK